MNIITLGPSGSYSSKVASKISGGNIEYSKSNTETIKLLSQYDLGIIPIENKYSGVISETIEALYYEYKKNNIKVLGHISLPINHVLATSGDYKIERIYSHPQALKQCKIEIGKMPGVMEIATNSTTSHIKQIQKGDGIICSLDSARKNGLKIVDSQFGPKDNITHFSILTEKCLNIEENIEITNGRVIAILENIEDKPGLLYESLEEIYKQGVSLHFILSLANGRGQYDFTIVMDSPKDKDLIKKSIKKRNGGKLKIL